MTDHDFDLIVIGGGPGGYVAALRAAQLGLSTALVERDQLGGICLNWGCIPTKALLHTAELLRQIRQAGRLGLRMPEPVIDFPAVLAHSRQVADRLQSGVRHLLRKAGVACHAGHGSLASQGGIDIRPADGEPYHLRARHILLATGASPRPLPALPFDGLRVWSYRDALAATSLPSSLLVVGAGAIGMELASFYATLGTRVTLLEARETLLPDQDEDVSAFLHASCERTGIATHTASQVLDAAADDGGLTLRVQGGGREFDIRTERVLVAVGLTGNSAGLGLEHTRVVVDRGFVATDPWGGTAHDGIYAVGDLTGAPMLAHRASHQAIACVERIAGLRDGQALTVPEIPACVFTHPPCAAIGLTEQRARQRGQRVRVGRFPLEANGKAQAIGEPHGFVKTIFDADTGALLGAHIVGAEAPELIHGFALASTLEATEADWFDTIFPHPTLSEATQEAALAAFGRALHI